MRVRVFLNDEDGHWFGYRPGHEVLEVIGYEDDDLRSDMEACERAFRLFNVDLEDLRNGELALARRYRDGRHRSLSVGDVIAIERGQRRQWWACAMMGWGKISKPQEARDGTESARPRGRADVQAR